MKYFFASTSRHKFFSFSLNTCFTHSFCVAETCVIDTEGLKHVTQTKHHNYFNLRQILFYFFPYEMYKNVTDKLIWKVPLENLK